MVALVISGTAVSVDTSHSKLVIGGGIIECLGRAWITIFLTFPGWAMWR